MSLCGSSLISRGGRYHGALRNEPHTRGTLHENEHLDFGPEHILDIADESGRKASDASNVVRCDEHGRSEACYVCEHLLHGVGLGFIAGGDPHKRRPDAWCAACDTLRTLLRIVAKNPRVLREN